MENDNLTVPGEGFSRQARLLLAVDYQNVFSKAHRERDRFFTILTRSNQCAFARLGLAVSKKNVSKLAVERNRIKRLIRESFRCSELRKLPIDIVVIPKHAVGRQMNATLINAIKQLFANVKEKHSN